MSIKYKNLHEIKLRIYNSHFYSLVASTRLNCFTHGYSLQFFSELLFFFPISITEIGVFCTNFNKISHHSEADNDTKECHNVVNVVSVLCNKRHYCVEQMRFKF